MRLLLDENISESVAARIRNAFPDTEHVRRVVGTGATDRAIWSYAAARDLTLVTLDDDFQILSLTLGAPPKVIWIDAHNPSTAALSATLLERADTIRAFGAGSESTVLVLRIARQR
jgi:predicted nuclease of predicted toxin-antitoxin system